jgi:hypothetical protein
MSREDGVWNEPLKCSVLSISYNFKARTGCLMMPEHTCCDMEGCVALFERIDPSVREIDTISGGMLDTIYRRGVNKKWHAQLPQ